MPLPTRHFAVAAAAILLAGPFPLFAGQVIVDTDFSQADPDGQLLTSGKPVDLAQLPLKMPTTARTNPKSTLKAGRETLGDLKPPYALIKLEQAADNPNASGGVALQWDLHELGLERGRYKLTYQIASLVEGSDGGKVMVTLADETGKPLSVHPTAVPMQVFFNKNKLAARYNGQGQVYGENQFLSVEITFDLDKKTWSASADDVLLADELPFPPEYLEASMLHIATLGLFLGGGQVDLPGTGWALAHMKLEKLD